jgi:hypothetical protein
MRLTALGMIVLIVILVGLSGLLLAPASFFVDLAK